MEDPAGALVHVIDDLTSIIDTLTADEAVVELDDATLQLFWREWPRLGGWGGELWRKLNADLDTKARPVEDPELDEIGGSG